MSGGAHTPGPWSIQPDYHHTDREEHPEHYFIQVGKIGAPDWKGSISGHMGLANANLVAAAPDMLDTLVSLDRWFDTDAEILDRMSEDERADHQRQHRMIRDAIAKARGAA